MTIARLIDWPAVEGRTTPLDLLAQLRVIDPAVELLYFGKGMWKLGGVRPNDERRKAGERILQQMEQLQIAEQRCNRGSVLLAQAMVKGFAQIQQYHCTGNPAIDRVTDAEGYECKIVEDFREREQNYRQDEGRKNFEARAEVASGDPAEVEKQAQYKEYLLTDGRARYKRSMRDKKTFGYGGMTGGIEAEQRSLIVSP